MQQNFEKLLSLATVQKSSITDHTFCMQNELLYQIALTLVPNIGAIQAKILIDHFGDGENVEVANIEFGEITGILEIKALNGAEVKYTEKRKNITPFGKALGIKEEILDKNISMRKYDDGWRIE